MDETSQADDEAAGTIKVFCISAVVILAGLLALIYLFGGGDRLKTQTQTIHVTQQ
jgi:hypothetical protein